MQSQATITIEVDEDGGVNFIVVGDEGRAERIAHRIMEAVVASQPPENYLGCEEPTKQ